MRSVLASLAKLARMAPRLARRRNHAGVDDMLASLGVTREPDGMFRGHIGPTQIVVSLGRERLKHHIWMSVSGDLPEGIIISQWEGALHVVGDKAIVDALLDDGPAGGLPSDGSLRTSFDQAVSAGWSFDAGVWVRYRPVRVPELESLVTTGVALADRLRAAYAALPDAIIAAARAEAEVEERLRAALEQGDADDPAIRDVTDVVESDVGAMLANAALTLEMAAITARKATGNPYVRVESLQVLVDAMHTHIDSIETLARGHLSAVLDRIIDERHLPREVAIAMADVLTRIEHPRGEAALLSLLTRDEDIRLAALEALGSTGSVAALPALLAHRTGPHAVAARDAIERIRARAGVEAGRLAIAETDGGLAVIEEA